MSLVSLGDRAALAQLQRYLKRDLSIEVLEGLEPKKVAPIKKEKAAGKNARGKFFKGKQTKPFSKNKSSAKSENYKSSAPKRNAKPGVKLGAVKSKRTHASR